MYTSSTHWLRRGIAAAFVGWALLAIVLSLAALRSPSDRLYHPFIDSRLGSPGVVQDLAPAAAGRGIEFGDRIVSVNGIPYAKSLRQGTDWMREGIPNTYVFRSPNGEETTYSLLPTSVEWASTKGLVLAHIVLVAIAAIYLVTGGAAWWIKPDRSEARALLFFCSTMAVMLATTVHSDFITQGWSITLINTPLIGAATFHLFTTFPIEPHWIVRRRRIQWVPYGIAAVLAVLSLAESIMGMPAASGMNVSFVFTCFMLCVSLGIVAIERNRHGKGLLRDHADLMMAAAIVSFLPMLGGFLLEWFTEQAFPYYYGLMLAFVFPLAVGYGILRRQLFELRNVAKSSAAYGAASIGITGGFALLITFADAAVSRLNINFRWFQVTFLFLAILLFNPLRLRLQSLVDRFFDRDRETYRVAVREISEAMVSMLSLSEIADRILVALTDTMGVERASVMMVDDGGRDLVRMASRGEWDEDALAVDIPSHHPIWKRLWTRREDLARIDFDDEPDVEVREACRDIFDTLEVELLVPILYGVDLLGVIAVSRKLSGDRLLGDDRMLLRTLANQSSIAIENAKAFDEIAKLNETLEARVEERTSELRDTQAQLVQAEKMKSLGQLVAGVAHELNNPIGFVHANLQLLDEYITKLVDGKGEPVRTREAINKLLMRSREGTERVKNIVQDLRTFSRMDHADLQDADLHEELERTLALMEPRFKNAIALERDFGKLPRVRCFPGQLNQVFLNLLMNACDAIESQGTVSIRTRPASGGVRLEFSDDGPGIPEDVKSRIFDPFFTTKPVGVGTGLGLSLSHGIIERHGGRISVESQAGQGTTFVIELPLVAVDPEASAA